MSEVLKTLVLEIEKLKKENNILSTKLSIAIEGLEVLKSDGNINGIPQKTLDEIFLQDQELPQLRGIRADDIQR